MMHIEKKFDYIGDPVIHIKGLKRYPANIIVDGRFVFRKIKSQTKEEIFEDHLVYYQVLKDGMSIPQRFAPVFIDKGSHKYDRLMLYKAFAFHKFSDIIEFETGTAVLVYDCFILEDLFRLYKSFNFWSVLDGKFTCVYREDSRFLSDRDEFYTYTEQIQEKYVGKMVEILI